MDVETFVEFLTMDDEFVGESLIEDTILDDPRRGVSLIRQTLAELRPLMAALAKVHFYWEITYFGELSRYGKDFAKSSERCAPYWEICYYRQMAQRIEDRLGEARESMWEQGVPIPKDLQPLEALWVWPRY